MAGFEFVHAQDTVADTMDEISELFTDMEAHAQFLNDSNAEDYPVYLVSENPCWCGSRIMVDNGPGPHCAMCERI